MNSAYVVAGLALAIYVAYCLIWPYCSCHRCQGSGKWVSPGGSTWRGCWMCGGRGYRRRFIAWLARVSR